jgi:hypothetical protein
LAPIWIARAISREHLADEVVGEDERDERDDQDQPESVVLEGSEDGIDRAAFLGEDTVQRQDLLVGCANGPAGPRTRAV